MNHQEAKELVDSLGYTHNESLFVRAVSWHETNYGRGWKQPGGKEAHNWGAITTLTGGAPGFKAKDSSYDAGQYETWFKGYPSDAEGARDVFRHAVLGVPHRRSDVQKALREGDVYAAVGGMYVNGYFMGIHEHHTAKGDIGNIQDYFTAVMNAIQAIIVSTGEQHIEREEHGSSESDEIDVPEGSV